MSNENIKIEYFLKFYNCLMKNAPDKYIPWFFPCMKNGKNPDPKAILKIDSNSKGSWHHESARLSKEQCIEHIKMGYNLGISARKGDKLVIGDIDEKEYLKDVPPNTLTVTSRKRDGIHFFGWDKDGSAKINQPTDYGEMRSENQYVLACGSYVPFDLQNNKDKKAFDNLSEETKKDNLIGYYTVRDELNPREIIFSDLPKFFQQEKREDDVADIEIIQREEEKKYNKDGKYSDLFKLKVSDIVGKSSSNKRSGHPLHESDTDANWSLSKDGNVGHCWRHSVCLNAIQYLCVKAGYIGCKDAGTPHNSKKPGYNGRKYSKLKGDNESLKIAYKEAINMDLIKEKTISKNKNILLDRITQTIEYHNSNPFFYDRNRIWFSWNKEKYRWDKSDEVDILADIYDDAGADITTSKERTEIINALKHVGRRNIPRELAGAWIQYKDTLYNIEDGAEIEATPKFFITNPIPHSMGDSEETPVIDKLFTSWVGKDHKQELYELLSFAQAPRYFIHRIICLIGSGSNGKSTLLSLLRNYLDDNNVVSSSLDALMKIRFEGSKLYKKLVCLMGETNFGTLTQTEYIKGLSGEDKMRIEFKGKDGFDAVNNAKLILATNSLPTTNDKTVGFYRRWKIINFNNQFKEEKDVLVEIPQEEYNNLAKKCFRILQEMWVKRVFTNDGNFEDRKANYEKHSNPLVIFMEETFEKNINSDYIVDDFREEFAGFLSEHGFRIMSPKEVTRGLNDNGYEIKQINRKGINRKRILGVKRRNVSDVSDVSENPIQNHMRNQIQKRDTSDTSDTKT